MLLACHICVSGVNPHSVVAWISIRRLSDSSRTRTHNHLVRKRRLNHLAANRTYEYSKLSSIIWPLWPNGWQLVYKLRVVVGSNPKLQISRLFRAKSSLTFRQYRVWIHSETRAWHDKNIQSECFILAKSDLITQYFASTVRCYVSIF